MIKKKKMQITRCDLYQSDGVVKGFEYPLHLVNDLARYNNHGSESTKAQLYSICFGNVTGLIEEEHLVDDVKISQDDTSITFAINRVKTLGHYPSEDLQLGFYPTYDNSKYLIFKYRLYKIDESNNNVEYLDKYYTMSVKNEDYNNLNIKIKIERL